MSAQPVKSYTTLAIAIVVAALVVGGAVFASSSFSRKTISTTTATSMTTATFTSILIRTVNSSGVPATSTVIETTTSTSTSVSTVTSTYQPFVAPLLQVELNTTEVGYHSGLTATITLTNLLPYNVSFVPTLLVNSSLLNWAGHAGLCGGTLFPDLFAFAVLQGHYTSANLSSAKPLTMAPPLLIMCPASPIYDRFVFLPNGSLFGYWVWDSSSAPPYFNAQDANTTSKFFNYFPPGEYTLAVQDIWGATLFSYFQVAAAPS